MPTDVVMPQMGESIAEGTIVRWIKKVGDKVDRDEPLFEISTDKVDAEIPSPAAGVLAEIRAKEGETVPVNSIVAVIGAAGEAKAAPAAQTPTAPAVKPVEPPEPTAQGDGASGVRGAGQPTPSRVELGLQSRPQQTEDAIRQRSSPLVRKIAKEHHVDISQLHGSGIAGRVTKADILQFIGREEQQGWAGSASAASKTGAATARQGAQASSLPAAPGLEHGEHDVVEKMSVMRKRIAEHMVLSRHTSAHVQEGGVRARRREAHLSLLHHQSRSRCAALDADRQLLGGRRLDHLSQGHQRRHRGGARLGAHRSGHQTRGREESSRRHARRRRSGEPRTLEAAQAGRRAGRYVHDHQPRRVRCAARHTHHQSATGGHSRRRQN